MKYRADLQVGGKVAGVGQRLLDSVGKAMARQGLESVNSALNARLAPADAQIVAAASAATLSETSRGRKVLLLILAVIAAALVVLAL